MQSVPARLALFAVGLVLVFGAAAAVGAAVDPGKPVSTCEPGHAGMSHTPPGLSSTQDGTAIAPAAFTVPPGRPQTLRFRVLGVDGSALRSGFEVEAQRRLHLIVVRRDLTGYQHLHPAMAADGTWSVPLEVAQPGAYRVFADFQRDCRKHVLAADLLAPGDFRPVVLPAPATTARTDGYDVRLEHSALRAGREAALRFTVARDGRPVPGIEPYLGARGHLVALRQGDLAYLHAHPEGQGDAADAIPFAADFVSPGAYRLFLQFKIDGGIHTAAFTVRVAP
jgi:hypothetical protein